jgi:hypothetical protein
LVAVVTRKTPWLYIPCIPDKDVQFSKGRYLLILSFICEANSNANTQPLEGICSINSQSLGLGVD